MGLPQPSHVEEAAARAWSPAFAQHALLFLGGLVRSLRNAAIANLVEHKRYTAKANELEIEGASLARAMREYPDEVPGSELSVRLCTLLACESEVQLAEVLGVPVAIVLAGRQRMYALAQELVDSGRSSHLPVT